MSLVALPLATGPGRLSILFALPETVDIFQVSAKRRGNWTFSASTGDRLLLSLLVGLPWGMIQAQGVNGLIAAIKKKKKKKKKKSDKLARD